jgi:hypothetical protein
MHGLEKDRPSKKRKNMEVLIKPLITEKMTAVTEKFPNRYGFIVDKRASKGQIKKLLRRCMLYRCPQ